MPLGVIEDTIDDASPFSRGDIVQLRSSGPLMTIESFQIESIRLGLVHPLFLSSAPSCA
jgi:hypothetical protein